MKQPGFYLYTGDWMKDPALRSVSYAARGLAIDMFVLMHESDRRGYLQLNGKPVTAEQLARMTGGSTDEVSRLLQELMDSGVFSCTDEGMYYSRRMVREEAKREKCAAAGKKGGGNPILTFKGQDKGSPKGTDKGLLEIEKEIEVKPKEKPMDEMVFDVMCGIGIPGSNPMLEMAIAEAIEAKSREPAFPKPKAAIHMIERGNAYKSSSQFHSQYKKTWLNWFRDQCYDQDPRSWNGEAVSAREILTRADDATDLIRERRARREANKTNGKGN